MKYLGTGLLLSFIGLIGCSPKINQDADTKKLQNTLLWKVSGNGLSKPSYVFGTIHLICKEDAGISENMEVAVKEADAVYFEIDLDDMMQMITMLSSMKMAGDTSLRDLLSEEDYNLVKNYFTEKASLLPFSMLETYKPILAASTLIQSASYCDAMTSMEQEIMSEAQKHNKEIKGLETLKEQAGFLDSIPYKLQAQQLVDYIKNEEKNGEDVAAGLAEMAAAYKSQNLDSLEALTKRDDMGIANFTDILLYRRNEKWAEALSVILPKGSFVIAVGAGHLPGEKGVLNLLKKQGYKVEPVENKIRKKLEI